MGKVDVLPYIKTRRHHPGLGLQSQLTSTLLLEIGYFDARSTKVIRTLSASPTSPVRGQTSNTFANNIQLAVKFTFYAEPPDRGLFASGSLLQSSVARI